MLLKMSSAMDEPLSERTIGGLHSALIHRLGPIDHGAPVLDIGCGTGAWLERLAANGFRDLRGIDIDIDQFQARDLMCSRIDLDVDGMDAHGKKYGLISAIELVEHLENPGRLFKLVSEHLDENGYFLLTTPNVHSLRCRLKFFLTGRLPSFDTKGDPTHIYPVLLTCLRRLLPRYALEVFELWSYPERGTRIYGRPITILSAALRLILRDQIPGDTLCLLIKKQA